MKTKITFFYLIAFLATMISCQNEISEVIQPSEGEVIKANTNVTNLVQRTATKDGSKDNIIDNASCLSVQLPISVVVNGLEITVDSEEDFDVIEAIFDEFDSDSDSLEIVFPIVIVLSDFTEINIATLEEFESFIAECGSENEPDDDIECVDFEYPITLSIFDSENQLAETVTVNNDEEFYRFIDDIEDYHVVQINFPIEVVLYDGTVITIPDMETLETVIEEAKDICDEDDDNDYDDDDCLTCTEEQITTLLLTCGWTVDKIEIDNVESTEQYTNYTFTFFEDGSVIANDNGSEINGTWMVETSGNEIFVTINFNNLTDFSFRWILYEMDDHDKIDLRLGDNRLKLEQICTENTAELIDILNEGTWLVANFNNKGENTTSVYNDFVLDFKEDFTVTAIKGDDVVNGAWAVVYDSEKLKLELDFGATIPFDEFNEDWLIVDIKVDRVEVNNLDNSGNEESNLVFERI